MHNYLGTAFIFDRYKCCGYIIDGYIHELINKYNIQGKSKTPCGVDLFDIDDTSPILEQ